MGKTTKATPVKTHVSLLETFPTVQDHEVFVSYRHTKKNLPETMFNDALAQALHTVLTEEYGIDTFRDAEELHFGDFRVQLRQNNKHSEYLLLLLSPGALDRCADPEDWVRQEIELYLRRGKPIIPVEINGFTYGDKVPAEIVQGLEAQKEKYGAIPCSITLSEEEKRYCNEFDRAAQSITEEKAMQAAHMIARKVYTILRGDVPSPTPDELVKIKEEKLIYSREAKTKNSYFYKYASRLPAELWASAFQCFALITCLPVVGSVLTGASAHAQNDLLAACVGSLIFVSLCIFAQHDKYVGKAFQRSAEQHGFWNSIRSDFVLCVKMWLVMMLAIIGAVVFGGVIMVYLHDFNIGHFLEASQYTDQELLEAAYIGFYTLVIPLSLYRLGNLALVIGHSCNARFVAYPRKKKIEKKLKLAWAVLVGVCVLLGTVLFFCSADTMQALVREPYET